MSEREHALVKLATIKLRATGLELLDQGWRPELIVFGPDEIERIPGYKVGLVVPLDSAPDPPAHPTRAT